MKAGDGEEGGRVIELNKLGPLSRLQYRESWREKDSDNHITVILATTQRMQMYTHI